MNEIVNPCPSISNRRHIATTSHGTDASGSIRSQGSSLAKGLEKRIAAFIVSQKSNLPRDSPLKRSLQKRGAWLAPIITPFGGGSFQFHVVSCLHPPPPKKKPTTGATSLSTQNSPQSKKMQPFPPGSPPASPPGPPAWPAPGWAPTPALRLGHILKKSQVI